MNPALYGDNKKGDKEADKLRKERERIEKLSAPIDIKMIRFTNFVCSEKHYIGEYGSGICQQLLETPDGQRSMCNKKLSWAPLKMRTRWQGSKVVVRGQVREKLPEGLKAELSLRFYRPGGTSFNWKEVTVMGKVKGKWRTFEVTFTFPRRATETVPTERGRLKTYKFNVEILDGDYWVMARFVKSKQSRYVRAKLTELEREIPDYKCMDCRKTFMQPTSVRCPSCNRKLDKPVKLYPEIKVVDGKTVQAGKIRTSFVCRRCNTEVPIEDLKECKYCQSKNLIPSKKDRQVYLEGQSVVHCPRPDFDPTSTAEMKRFNQAEDRVTKKIQKHYADIIKEALELSKKLDHNFAAAYKSHFFKDGKVNEKDWKQWVFGALFPEIKADSAKGRSLYSELKNNYKFISGDRFKKESWNSFVKDEALSTVSKLLFKNFEYQKSHLILRYPNSQVYLDQLVRAIEKKALNYTGQLYSANKLEFDPKDFQLYVPPGVPEPMGTGNAYLNFLFKKIDREVKVMEYWQNN